MILNHNIITQPIFERTQRQGNVHVLYAQPQQLQVHVRMTLQQKFKQHIIDFIHT